MLSCRDKTGFLEVAYEGRLRIGIPMQSWVPAWMGNGWGWGIWVLIEQEDRDPCTGPEQFLGKGRQAWGLTRRFLGRMRGLFCPFILW